MSYYIGFGFQLNSTSVYINAADSYKWYVTRSMLTDLTQCFWYFCLFCDVAFVRNAYDWRNVFIYVSVFQDTFFSRFFSCFVSLFQSFYPQQVDFFCWFSIKVDQNTFFKTFRIRIQPTKNVHSNIELL